MVAAFNYFYRVSLTVARFEGGAKLTRQYEFVSKSLKDNAAVASYWPILRTVGEMTVAAGDPLPAATVSSIELDNSIGSFGAGRKFSDVLQYYTPVEQTLVVYVAQVTNDSDTVSSWTQMASGVVSNWEAASGDGNGTLTLNVRPFKLDEKVVTLEVARTVSGMENAPTTSLGRAVPLLVGEAVEVIPVRITADGATTAKYAVGTCFYNHLKNVTSAANVYTKNYLDDWEQVANVLSIYQDTSASASAGTYTLNTYGERICAIGEGGRVLVTGVQLYAQGNGLAASNARLTVTLYRTDYTSRNIVEEVASGTVTLSNYNAQNAASTASFAINVSFEQPAYLSSYASTPGVARSVYAVGFSCTGYAVGDLSLHYTSVTLDGFVRDTADSGKGFEPKYLSSGVNILKLKLLTTTHTFSDHVAAYTSAGLTYSTLQIAQFTPDTGQANPPLDNLPVMVANVQGLSTYASGSSVSKPSDFGYYLSFTWNGSAWADPGTFDLTAFPSHYAALYNGTSFRSRSARGVLDAKVTMLQALQAVARGTASKVGVTSAGKVYMYPWGHTATPAFDIPSADIIALSWQQRDSSTVVNQAVVSVERSPRYAGRDFQNPGEVDGYAATTDFSADNYAQVRAITAESRAVYGVKPLADGLFPMWSYPSGSGLDSYLGDSSARGSVLAEYYLARFAKPLVYCSFVVPWHRYSAVKLFDVVTFTSPAFPAFYGTDPDPRQSWVVDTGSSVTTVNITNSYDTVQAQTYRGLVEGISYVMAMEHAPAIRLTVLVLLNHATDPT